MNIKIGLLLIILAGCNYANSMQKSEPMELSRPKTPEIPSSKPSSEPSTSKSEDRQLVLAMQKRVNQLYGEILRAPHDEHINFVQRVHALKIQHDSLINHERIAQNMKLQQLINTMHRQFLDIYKSIIRALREKVAQLDVLAQEGPLSEQEQAAFVQGIRGVMENYKVIQQDLPEENTQAYAELSALHRDLEPFIHLAQ